MLETEEELAGEEIVFHNNSARAGIFRHVRFCYMPALHIPGGLHFWKEISNLVFLNP